MESRDFVDIVANADQDLENNNDPNNNSSDNEGPTDVSDPIPGPSNPVPSNQVTLDSLGDLEWLSRYENESRSSNQGLDYQSNLLAENRKKRSWDDDEKLNNFVLEDRGFERNFLSDFGVWKRRKFPPPSSTITSADAEETKRDYMNLKAEPSGIKKSETNGSRIGSKAAFSFPKTNFIHSVLPSTSSASRFADESSKNQTLKSSSQTNVKGPSGASNTPAPEIIDLTDSPPHISDFHPQSDTDEAVSNLSLMFPNTPIEYLRHGASKIVKETPEYFDWFVFDLGSRNGVPPTDWELDILFAGASGPSSHPMQSPRRSSPRVARGFSQTFDLVADILAPLVRNDKPIIVDDPSPLPFPDLPTPLDPLPAPPVVEIDSEEVPKDEEMIASKFETLCSLFPKTDPDCLYIAAETFYKDEASFSAWVTEHMETRGSKLATREKYDKNVQKAKLLEKFQAQVSVTDLLATYEDPEGFFLDRARPKTDLYIRNALNQLKRDYIYLHCNVILKAFYINNELYLPTLLYLQERKGPLRKRPRGSQEVRSDQDFDEIFLKERQYVSIRDEVQSYVLSKKRDRENRLEEARTRGLLRVCDCCASDDCLGDEMLSCEGGHEYCVECIKRASNVAIGDGKIDLKCLMHCEKAFSLATLQKALSPNTFSKWLQRIQLEELQKANIDGLETCPFCTFATIIDVPAEDFKVFTCLNPECGKESCRLCKEISHIPLRCNEVERDKEVQMRTYIENKMTEALVRKCYKCDRPYVKLDGCNKITCTHCGSKMCYICRKPVKNYSHFYGQGAQASGNSLCPLWTDNNTIHNQDVARGALEAKEKMTREQPGVELKHDPTKGLDLSKDLLTPAPLRDVFLDVD